MVYKHHKLLMRQRGPCDQPDNKRKLTIGANIEQRRWLPAKRKGRIVAENLSPGPACVKLPPFIGPLVPDSKKRSSPAYSFGQKVGRRHETLGPGPAQYDIYGLGAKGKAAPPAASLRSRLKYLEGFKTPSPGKYNVTRASKRLIDKIPQYSFGQKIHLGKPSIVPGPNVYKIPTAVGANKEGPIRSAPAYSMGGRVKPRLLGLLNAPGPGSYDGNYLIMRKQSPSYSMRKLISGRENTIPGPNKYCPEKFIRHKSIPAPSFSIHHTPYLGFRKPYHMPTCPKKMGAKWCG